MDEELELASKKWSRVIDSAVKTGYREGVEDGSQSVYQEGFDTGFEEGMKVSFILGQYKGLITILPDDFEYPSEISDILSVTRRGSCYICTNNLNIQPTEIEKPISDIVLCQKDHSEKVISTLYNFFKPLMEEKGIDIGHLKL